MKISIILATVFSVAVMASAVTKPDVVAENTSDFQLKRRECYWSACGEGCRSGYKVRGARSILFYPPILRMSTVIIPHAAFGQYVN
ncbi:Protein of unknown function [Pyronema omphalodes CBS 100304]|uniref:Uncharacterized protein n=1 Tax=Pyronema omphalodes (strain CBS 100304) TaxID=1076935 RepID=U4LU67_PYROM|nr:Protein of unknown function [Pyronema omphalodes CBS 100304]